jgi:DNA-directed RNA polymerase specialized sigma24 family protein
VRQTARQTGPRPVPDRPEGYAPELEAFYRQFFLPLVRRAVRKQGLSMEDAGDVVQDAFILALGKLDPSKNPKAWLYQVVDHLAVNWKRKIQRRASLLAKWDSAGSTDNEGSRGPDHGSLDE